MTAPPVLLLHGLARTHLSMGAIAADLRAHGRRVWLRTYPSRRLGVPALAETVAGWVATDLGAGPFDVVTHSLGGVLARHLAGSVPLRRVVMLAPPNAGSDLARSVGDIALFRWIYGPAGRDVQDAAAWPDLRDVEVGVIAGTRGRSVANPISWVSSALGVFGPARASDGTVAVDETKLPGMADFLQVDASHTWIMRDPVVLAAVRRFLERGRFAA